MIKLEKIDLISIGIASIFLVSGLLFKLDKEEVQLDKSHAVAEVAKKQGRVRVGHSRTLVWTDAIEGSLLEQGDKVYTREDSSVELEFSDFSINVAPNSLVLVEQSNDQELELNLVKGKIQVSNTSKKSTKKKKLNKKIKKVSNQIKVAGTKIELSSKKESVLTVENIEEKVFFSQDKGESTIENRMKLVQDESFRKDLENKAQEILEKLKAAELVRQKEAARLEQLRRIEKEKELERLAELKRLEEEEQKRLAELEKQRELEILAEKRREAEERAILAEIEKKKEQERIAQEKKEEELRQQKLLEQEKRKAYLAEVERKRQERRKDLKQLENERLEKERLKKEKQKREELERLAKLKEEQEKQEKALRKKKRKERLVERAQKQIPGVLRFEGIYANYGLRQNELVEEDGNFSFNGSVLELGAYGSCKKCYKGRNYRFFGGLEVFEIISTEPSGEVKTQRPLNASLSMLIEFIDGFSATAGIESNAILQIENNSITSHSRFSAPLGVKYSLNSDDWFGSISYSTDFFIGLGMSNIHLDLEYRLSCILWKGECGVYGLYEQFEFNDEETEYTGSKAAGGFNIYF